LFSESKILHWFVQLALGLHYMHTNKVLHRDLKTQNVFMLGNGRLVLGDLGISKVLDGTMDFAQTCIGTPYCTYHTISVSPHSISVYIAVIYVFRAAWMLFLFFESLSFFVFLNNFDAPTSLQYPCELFFFLYLQT
jgi:serine/threonine protein kinase